LNAEIPLLEFDSAREAMIEPARVFAARPVAAHCVICFFREVVLQTVAENGAREVAAFEWEDGPHPLYEMEFAGQPLAFYNSPVGAAASALLLEEVIALGCRKFIVCGGCGVLAPEIAIGHLVVLTGALRDEGVTYHYLPPARVVSAPAPALAALESVLRRRELPYALGQTWTTDAPYRETRGKVAQRRAEGCAVVEMEAAALLAVAQHRGVPLGQVVYGGDDLSGAEWDNRDWRARADVRGQLFRLAAEACLEL